MSPEQREREKKQKLKRQRISHAMSSIKQNIDLNNKNVAIMKLEDMKLDSTIEMNIFKISETIKEGNCLFYILLWHCT